METSLESKAYQVLANHLEALGLSYEIAWPNVSYPAKGKRKPWTFLQVDMIQNGSVDYAIDDEPAQIQGIFQVSALTRTGRGLAEGQDIAGQVIDHFAKDMKLWGDGMFVQIDGRPDLAGPYQDENRMRFPISINFQAYETEA